MSRPITSFPRLDSVQALRGVAANLVLLFHIFEWHRLAQPDAISTGVLPRLWARGFMGVDLFFVISGFIMVYVTANRQAGVSTARQFLWARVTRIYPLWWVFAGLMAVYFWSAYGVPVDPARAEQSGGSVSYIFKSYALWPQAAVPVLGVGWTLIHEMYFYIGFGALLVWVAPRHRVWGLGVWATGVAAYGVLNPNIPDMAVNVVTLVTSPLTLEFLAGAAAAVVLTRGFIRGPLFCAGLGALLTVMAIVAFDPAQSGNMYWHRTLYYAVPIALLLYGLCGLEVTRKPVWQRFVTYAGDISYSLYLSHILVLSALAHFMTKLGMPLSSPGVADEIIFTALGIAGCIGGAVVSYEYIEKPLMRWLRPRPSRAN